MSTVAEKEAVGTLSFHQALEKAEGQARRSLVPALHPRLTDAVELVQGGRVFQASDGTWKVDSTSSQGLTYTVNGQCPYNYCYYNKPLQGLCKHRIAVYLSRRVYELMVVRPDGIGLAESAPARDAVSTADTTPPLPEARASVNLRLVIGGREVQWTLRDHDEVRLATRLEALLARYPMPAPQAPAQGQLTPQQHNALAQGQRITGVCPVHNVQMKENHKDGRSWWSHKTDQGWCKGK